MDSPISPLQTHGWPSDSNHFPPSPPPHPDPLPSYWLQNWSSVLTHAGMDAELPQEADVVVIGSGLTGTCFVDELVRLLTGDEGGRFEGRTVKVVVLEARTFCSGATGAYSVFVVLVVQEDSALRKPGHQMLHSES